MRLRIQPWLFCAPLLVGVALVFLWPLVSLFRYSFQRVGSGYIDERVRRLRQLPLRLQGPAVLEGDREQRHAAALRADPHRALDRPRHAPLRSSARLAGLPHVRLPSVHRSRSPSSGSCSGTSSRRTGSSTARSDRRHLAGPDWLGSSSWAIWTIMAVIVWKELGFGVIALPRPADLAFPRSIFEAARIDGAGWWQRLRHVIVPQLAPAIVFYAIVETITMLSWVFAYIYVMTAGGPGNSTVVSEYYIYQQTFQNTVIGIGAAAAVTLLGVRQRADPRPALADEEGGGTWRLGATPSRAAALRGAGRPRYWPGRLPKHARAACSSSPGRSCPLYFMVVNGLQDPRRIPRRTRTGSRTTPRSRRSATRSGRRALPLARSTRS